MQFLSFMWPGLWVAFVMYVIISSLKDSDA